MSAAVVRPFSQISNDENMPPSNVEPERALKKQRTEAPEVVDIVVPTAAPASEPAKTEDIEEDLIDEEYSEEEEYEDDDGFIVKDYEDDEAPVEEKPEDEKEGDQAEEVDAPLAPEQEASAAIEFAKQKGLQSTDDAATLVGVNRPEQKTLQNYFNIIEQDGEIVAAYSNIDKEINECAASTREGLTKLAAAAQVPISASGVEAARNVLLRFVSVVGDLAETLADYRNSETITARDFVSALASVGRKVYWEREFTAEEVEQEQEKIVEDEDNDEEDGDFSPEEEEEEDDTSSSSDAAETEMPQADTAEDTSAREFQLKSETFIKIVDVAVPESVFTFEAYEVIQTASEEYISQLLAASLASASFRGAKEVSEADVKFTLNMWSNGDNEIARRLQLL